jgi:serine beta-lactamase-like protein LACTB
VHFGSSGRNLRSGRITTWLLLSIAAVGLLIVAVPALWVYMSLTAKPLHPDPAKVPTVAHAAPSPRFAPAAEKARQAVLTHLIEKNLPGLSVAVGVDGDLAWAEGFGYADLRTNSPVTPDHRFRIGNASTVLTSAAAGLLLESDRLKLDEPIQNYVPAFPRKQQPVTLRQLMGHTAGLIPDGGDEGPLYAQHCGRPAEALRYFAEESLLFQPGTRYRYSNYSWIVVSAAIETAADQPFFEFMRKQVFEPLGMDDTQSDSAPAEDDEDHPLFNLVRELIVDPRTRRNPAARHTVKPGETHVTSYFPRFAADPKYGLHLMRPLDYSCYSGSAAFLSTPSDLVRFAMAIHGGKLLNPATVAILQTPQRLPSGEETGYGLGWDLETVRLGGKTTRVVGHDGDALGGVVASLSTFPEHGIVVAVTSNISYAHTSSLAVKIAEAFAVRN